ncbi:MAG: hypothetical protein QSU88_07045, partial [Candidatus Methanoperedens sp.]|nr:hypothetical protein [Candidatus Methanoperedens sp.]
VPDIPVGCMVVAIVGCTVVCDSGDLLTHPANSTLARIRIMIIFNRLILFITPEHPTSDNIYLLPRIYRYYRKSVKIYTSTISSEGDQLGY